MYLHKGSLPLVWQSPLKYVQVCIEYRPTTETRSEPGASRSHRSLSTNSFHVLKAAAGFTPRAASYDLLAHGRICWSNNFRIICIRCTYGNDQIIFVTANWKPKDESWNRVKNLLLKAWIEVKHILTLDFAPENEILTLGKLAWVMWCCHMKNNSSRFWC